MDVHPLLATIILLLVGVTLGYALVLLMGQ
jgi:hypothetical protein